MKYRGGDRTWGINGTKEMKLRTQKLVTCDKMTTKKIQEGLGNEGENSGTRS